RGRAGEVARAALILREECEVGARPGAPRGGPAGLLGDVRLPQLRRSMAGAAVLGRLTWQLANVVELVTETPQTKSIVLDVPGWPRHRAGQHGDARLTAPDRDQAPPRYSIPSA